MVGADLKSAESIGNIEVIDHLLLKKGCLVWSTVERKEVYKSINEKRKRSVNDVFAL